MPDINLRVQIEGMNELLQGLQRVTTNVRTPMRRLQERLLKRLKTYPPPPPASTYIRTGDLGRAWAVSVDARGTNLFQDRVSVELRNDVTGPRGQHYAGWVQGAGTQAAIHRDRWETTQQVVDAETGPFLQDAAAAIEGAFH